MAETLSVKEAAEMMKVHPRTVLELIGSCAIPAAKIGRSYVIMTTDVIEFIDSEISMQTSARMRSTKGSGPAPTL